MGCRAAPGYSLGNSKLNIQLMPNWSVSIPNRCSPERILKRHSDFSLLGQLQKPLRFLKTFTIHTDGKNSHGGLPLMVGRPEISITGRISTVPTVAAGIRPAIAIASSRSFALIRYFAELFARFRKRAIRYDRLAASHSNAGCGCRGM